MALPDLKMTQIGHLDFSPFQVINREEGLAIYILLFCCRDKKNNVTKLQKACNQVSLGRIFLVLK